MRFGHSAILPALALAACTQDYDYIEWDVVDIFYQNPTDEVDILMVIDNSGSMQSYQEELGTNFSQFITYFVEADVDYQIAAITTDVMGMSAGKIIGDVITTETPDPAATFAEIVNVGIMGSGFEMGLEAAYLALTEPVVSGANAGFLREEATLSVIFVSDEEDSSPLPVNDYINAFRDVKGQRSRDVFSASSLVVTDYEACLDPADPCDERDNDNDGEIDEYCWSTEGDRYIDVAAQTDGIIGDICADDFASIITELSLNTSRLRDTFHLSTTPDASSLELRVDDELVDCTHGSWTYARVEDEFGEIQPSIVFDRAQMPPSNSQLAVRYYEGSGDPGNFCGGTGTSDTDDDTATE